MPRTPQPHGDPVFGKDTLDDTVPQSPRFLYVAACYTRRDSSAYHLLVTSEEEYDLETVPGAGAIICLLAQASERRDWFANDAGFRDEVRLTGARIGDEYHELRRYALAAVLVGTGAWAPQATDPRIWGDNAP